MGISSQCSDVLKSIELEQVQKCTYFSLYVDLKLETQFTAVLRFHQALGRGVLSFLDKREESTDAKEAIQMRRLLGLLERLLPAASDHLREVFTKKVYDMALALKRAMMEELALYRVFWIDCGAEFREDVIELVDDDDASFIRRTLHLNETYLPFKY
jgi:hypothetical protein